MKKLSLLLILAASVAFAQEAARSTHRTLPAQSPCVPLLRPQMQADNVIAFHLQDVAYRDGLEKGLAFGAGGMLLIIGVVLEIKKLQRDKTSKPQMARAASV